MMWWLGLLFLAHLAFAVNPKSWSTLQGEPSSFYTFPPTQPQSGTPAPKSDDDDDDDDDNTEENGFPHLRPKMKKKIVTCVLDPWFRAQLDCGNNPYSGTVRLSFHDCGTFDSTATTNKGGCNAWMTKKCTDLDACEYTNPDNNGLQKWVDSLDKMYNEANVNGKSLSTLISRADFWHLAAFHAVRKSSHRQVNMTYQAGREDPDMPEPGPRFPGRLPQAFGWEEMQRVARRNGMSDTAAAALIGAHTIGGCHPTTSGYQGTWDDTPFVFDERFWVVLLDAQWFTHTITATNDQTGEQTVKQQFSLKGAWDSSVMLFSDMGSHVNLSTCDVNGEDVSQGLCPVNNQPTSLPKILRAWADNPASFYNAFARAFTQMNSWGCSDCYNVTEYAGDVDCDSKYKPPTCTQPYFKKPYSTHPGWTWYTSMAPTSTQPPTQAPWTPAPTTTTQAPYTRAPWTPAPTTTTQAPYTRAPATTQAPTTTTQAPYTTQRSYYYPAPTPTPTTTQPPTTTAAYKRYYLEKK